MSVEVLTIASIVEGGAPVLRRLYSLGISSRDFPVYEDEFKWIERRLAGRKTMNRRVFRQKFHDFEWSGVPSEATEDLAAELKEERAFEEVNAIVATLNERLERDNAVELATEMRERLGLVTRHHLPMADVNMDEYDDVIEEMRQGMLLARQGLQAGIPTGLAHVDHHLGGWMPGHFIQFLGRTGEGKSLLMTYFAWIAKKNAYKVGLFTPEMSKHEVRSRYHTMASADPGVQKACELPRSFRNRALLFRRGFNIKSYERFCKYMHDEVPGSFHMLSGTHRPEQMTVGYIEDRIVELELDLVIVDPIYLLKPVRLSQGGNEYQETAWTAEALHTLSERYNIPIIFTNQAHMDGKEDAPHKSGSFGAKGMVHLADYVIGVKHMSEENRMIVRSSKSRFGEGFRFDLAFYANTGVIKELTPLRGSYFNGKDQEVEDDELRELIERATT